MADLPAWLLPDYPGWLLGYIFFAFLLAGTVKGFLGLGLPAVLIATLTLFIPPVEALSLIVVPMLATNVFQYLRSRDRLATARRYWLFALLMLATITVVAVNLPSYPKEFLLASIGFAMALFALTSLSGLSLSVSGNPGWQVLGGLAAGALGGVSGVWAPPVVIYLMGRNIGKEEFIGAVGFLFMAGSVGLVAVLGGIDVVTLQVAGRSVATLAVALVGFRIGERLRDRIDGAFFRKCVLVAFLVMGARLMLVGLFG